MDIHEIQMANMKKQKAIMLLNSYYTACLLKQTQGLQWTADQVRAEILEDLQKLEQEL